MRKKEKTPHCRKGHEIYLQKDDKGFFWGTNCCRLTPYYTFEVKKEKADFTRQFTDYGLYYCHNGNGCLR